MEEAEKGRRPRPALAEQAAAAEKDAAAASSDRDRDRRSEDAKQLRQQAQQTARRRSLREAERERRGRARARTRGACGSGESRPVAAKEEVEKTLNALLNDLEPWSSTLEVTGEGRPAAGQKELMALEELERKGLTGKNREGWPSWREPSWMPPATPRSGCRSAATTSCSSR
ncbi:MAG: hypothetical protein U0736_17180 [Gemmataceae bacterium]